MPPVGTLEVLVILIAIVLFGPRRIPELARQIGSALAEFRKASDGFMRELTQVQSDEEAKPLPRRPRRPGGPPKKVAEEKPAEPPPEPLTGEQIRDAALKLGIKVDGKTDEEIRSEMLERIYSGHQQDPHGADGKAG